jgi:hypothetical protein
MIHLKQMDKRETDAKKQLAIIELYSSYSPVQVEAMMRVLGSSATMAGAGWVTISSW